MSFHFVFNCKVAFPQFSVVIRPGRNDKSQFCLSSLKNQRGIVRKSKLESGSKANYFHAGYSGRGGGHFVKDFIATTRSLFVLSP
jgi:hypothetical protein